MWRLALLPATLASLALAGCQFDRPLDIDPVDARVIDAVDAPPPCAPSTIVCDDAQGVYTECDAAGTVVRQLTCPLGCATDTEQCLDIDPHNGLAMYLDMVADPPDVVLAGAARIDPETGVLFDGPTAITVPTFIAPAGLRVFVFASLTIDGSLSVTPMGSRTWPIALLATRDMTIRGPIDVSAARNLAGPGGISGGDLAGDDLCPGGNTFFAPPAPSPGAGGGGGWFAGGIGGAINGTAGSPGGLAQREIEPFAGGCAGGIVYGNTSSSATGGGGGGALQLASRTRITFEVGGGIDASGGGGGPGFRNIAGAGGGAGGKVLIEAPQVILDGAGVVISTKGGGGAGASDASASGGPGEDGGTAANRAQGGSSPIGNIGGAGGVTTEPYPGTDAMGGGVSGGGGGGSPGTIAYFTMAGAINPINGATNRSPTIIAPLATRTIRDRPGPDASRRRHRRGLRPAWRHLEAPRGRCCRSRRHPPRCAE
ncbi:MAG: hypothetical protein IPL61_19255 [Myxococcales bacterium]|nr:hypothetical protein [Myxococcales bacterium]